MRQTALLIVVALTVFATVTRAAPRPPATQRADVWPRLHDRIDEISFEGLTLPQAVLALQEKTGINIIGHWLRVNTAYQTTPLQSRLRNVSVQTALVCLLEEACGGNERIMWKVADEGYILLSVWPPMETRVYHVGKLAETVAAESAGSNADKGDAMFKLARTITYSIGDPDTWRENGGVEGTIHVLGKRLVITATADNHAKIAKLLQDLEAPDAK